MKGLSKKYTAGTAEPGRAGTTVISVGIVIVGLATIMTITMTMMMTMGMATATAGTLMVGIPTGMGTPPLS